MPTAITPAEFPWFDYSNFSFSLGLDLDGRVAQLSGHSASEYDPGTGKIVVNGDMTDQTRTAYTKAETILAAAGYTMDEVIHVVDSPDQRASHVTAAASPAGDLRRILAAFADFGGTRADHEPWIAELVDAESAAASSDATLLAADADPVVPTRIYGELRQRLDRDAIVVNDGGDFVSYSGKYIDSYEPGCWLDPGPYGCLGTGLGYAAAARIAHPDRQVVAMLGDGAAGFSLMDVDTLVRHDLPVVMVMGNNGIWGLEKHPMQALYGYDVAADLQPGLRYDDVVTALGGAGEVVERPEDIGPALDRAFASGVPYLVNVLTDPANVYPRSSNLG